MKRMTERAYMKHCDECNGLCTKCGAKTELRCEWEARVRG